MDMRMCPFCGSLSLDIVWKHNAGSCYAVCYTCGANGPSQSDMGGKKDVAHIEGAAKQKWNRRHPTLKDQIAEAAIASRQIDRTHISEIDNMRAVLKDCQNAYEKLWQLCDQYIEGRDGSDLETRDCEG